MDRNTDPPLKYAFVVNPKSGRRKGDKVRNIIQEFGESQKWNFEIFRWDHPDSLYPMMQEILESSFDIVVAVGGDGTLHLVAEQLIGTDLALALIPTGTGNAFANHFNIPHKPEKALELLLEPHIVSIDIGEVNDVPFVGFFGFGLDAQVAHRYTKVKNRNLYTYFSISISCFWNSVPEVCLIEYLDDEGNPQSIEWKCNIVTAANIAEFGLKAKAAPGASALDGKLDLAGLYVPNLWHLPRTIWRIFRGTLLESKNYTKIQSTEFTITRTKPEIAQIDGEPFQTSEKIELKVKPKNLKVVLPKDRSETW